MLCTYCDTMYAVVGKKFRKMSIDNIMKEVRSLKNEHICLTGGEPLMQEEAIALVYELANLGYKVNIETNGGVHLPDDRSLRNFTYTMDLKTPISGMEDKNIYENIAILSPKDELKFVCADEADFIFAKKVLDKYPTKAQIIFSPLFRGKNSTIMNDLAQWVLEEKIKNARIGIQIHKIIGVD